MKTTGNIFRTLLLAVLTLTFGACGEDSLLSELGLDGQTATKAEEAGVWQGNIAESFAGGSGTAEDPYLIADGAQLAKLAQDVNNGNNYAGIYFVLTADILLNDISNWTSWNETTAPTKPWTPIGSYEQRFSGTLDGDGHSVSGIYINSTANYQGLVGYLDNGGTLQNLGVKASYIKGGYYVGGVCGENSGTVTNCYNTGSVEGNNSVGGVCGYNNGGTVTNCYNTGNLTGTGDYVGGVCGRSNGNVNNCHNAGNLTGTGDYVGGVCGTNAGTVTNCYNTGSVAGNYDVGGLCGRNYGTVNNCYNTGSVAGNYDVGGVCGENYATVTNCYYLDTCGAAGEGTSKTKTEFQSGEVAWLLQNGQAEQVWGQTIGTDEYPVLGGEKVYQYSDGTYGNTPLQAGEDGFYLISTADELRLFASMVNGGQTSINAKLTADIELNNTTGWENWGNTPPANSWTPIGSYFTGTFDGQGHTISGLYVNNSDYSSYYAGLFGCLENGGTVENVGVTKSYIQSSVYAGYTGGIVGLMNGGTIRNCYCTGIVRCQGYGGGGIVGMSYDNSTIENCYFAGRISSEYGSAEMIGPIVGDMYAEGVNPTNCFYLEGCGASGKGTSKTAKQFQSGEVASLLGEGWGQTIGTDDYPVLTSDASKKVYAYTMYQGQSQSTETGYANNNGNVDLDLASHPNTIAVFEASGTFTGKNIVVKDGDNSYTCAELVLTDDADFYTPVKFTATNATYTRMPKVWANGESGWETICLPFSGTLYANGDAKQPVDVASNNGAYWLRSLTGFTEPNTLIFASPATAADNQIEAGVPYLIALPGNTFGSESLEGQTISVRGTNVAVTNVAQSVQPEGSLFAFTGTFATKACDAASYRLNSENGSKGAGNLFVLDTNKLAPFRCRVDVTGLNIDGASTRSASGLPKELRIGQ